MGHSLSTDEAIAKDGEITFTRTSFAHMAVLMLVLLVLGVAKLLISLEVKPIAVWATLMACSAFGWLCIRSDLITSLSLSYAVFFVWIISSYQYYRSAFEKLQALTLLAIVGMAIALDVLIARYMTPIGAAAGPLTILLNLSLPIASLVLGTTAVGLSMYRRWYSEAPGSGDAFPLQQIP